MNNKYKDGIPWEHQDDDLIFEDDDETFDKPELADVKIGNEETEDTEPPYQYNQDTADITDLIPKRYLVDEEENKKKDTQGH
jgi:hypothetical protein